MQRRGQVNGGHMKPHEERSPVMYDSCAYSLFELLYHFIKINNSSSSTVRLKPKPNELNSQKCRGIMIY